MIRRLRRKFVLINMSIVTVILAAVFVVLLSMTKAGARADSMLVLHRAVAGPDLVNTLSENAEQVQIPFFTVDVDAAGHIAVLNGGYYDLADRESIESIVASSMLGGSDVGTLEEFGLRFYREFRPGGMRIAYADVSFENSVAERFVENALVIGAATLLVFFGISVLLARWAVRPVEEAWTRQKRFVEDASHELRTPLTVVLSSADMLLAHPNEQGERTAQWARNIKLESQRMRALVDELLALARVEHAPAPARQQERVDLSALATDAALQLEAAVYEAGKTLESGVEEGVVVMGAASRLQQLLDNLLGNALRYSNDGGEISLTLARRGRKALLSVSNTGEPIPNDRLEHIFERFYRLDEARSSDGCGLGLAIAKGIVEQHRGRIWAESGGYGNRFCVELPCVS